MKRLEREINSEVKARWPAGMVRRVTVLQHGDDPAIGPDDLLVRVFVEAGGESEDYQRSLDEWAQAHRAAMKRVRRELSLRLPEARLAAGEYDRLDEEALAERLTSDLHEVCDDKHLRVGTMPPRPTRPKPGEPSVPGPAPRPPAGPGPGLRPRNYGIYRAERLDGNVGYLDVRGVPGPEEAGPVIAAAMELIAGTYALIIDLRRNHGGSPHAVVLWCSYFFPDGGTHLNDIFHADTGETRQFWSLAYLPGSRYLDRPVYLLTSSETFSGGEDFAYTLQAQGRAEVIGETTGGGAHPTRMIPISATMSISVPFARSVNPVTGTNWQGTGVIPDTAVPAADAHDVAFRKALQHVLSTTVPPPIADEAREALAALPSEDQP